MTVIVRQKREGTGWIYEKGYPPNPEVRAYHCIRIREEYRVFSWNPVKQLWTCGLVDFAPADMSAHNYESPCSVVFFRWVEPKKKVFRR